MSIAIIDVTPRRTGRRLQLVDQVLDGRLVSIRRGQTASVPCRRVLICPPSVAGKQRTSTTGAYGWNLRVKRTTTSSLAGLSATLENEAIATVENEATHTDWMGDLGGGLGVDQAACRGRSFAAAGRAAVGDRAGDGRSGGGVGPAAEVRASGCADGVHAI